MIRPHLPLALVALIFLAGCEKEEVASPSDALLLDIHWQLTQLDDIPTAAFGYPGASQASLDFVGLSQCTVGLGPCNNFSGHFALGRRDQQLRISPQIPTRVACPAQAFETQYLTRLAQTTHYAISGNELRLYDATAAVPRLVFQRAVRQE